MKSLPSFGVYITILTATPLVAELKDVTFHDVHGQKLLLGQIAMQVILLVVSALNHLMPKLLTNGPNEMVNDCIRSSLV
jgi:hypothetical protein